MMKLLHSADWHLGTPFQGRSSEQAAALRRELWEVPGKIAALCREENCDLVLLSGDLLDGPCSQAEWQRLKDALEEMAVPVFVSPGNHDFVNMDSPWIRENWPENVHIFTRTQIESVELPNLSCRVYGAGFTGMDCQPLLDNFRAEEDCRYHIGVFHGDPALVSSAYNPITAGQVESSGLDYLALGHIHKMGAFRAGKTLCAWPGCPMGRGYDETGDKGVYIVTVGEQTEVKFRVLNTPRFYDLQTDPQMLDSLLPPVGSMDYYRITLVGSCEAPDLDAMQAGLSRFPNLLLRDKTTRPIDVWGSLGQDNFEGVYFGLLRQAWDTAEGAEKEDILLAAQLSRQLLEGQEVVLP